MSELSYSPVEWFRVALVVQRTQAYRTDLDIQRGFLVGFSCEKVNFTAYISTSDGPSHRSFSRWAGPFESALEVSLAPSAVPATLSLTSHLVDRVRRRLFLDSRDRVFRCDVATTRGRASHPRPFPRSDGSLDGRVLILTEPRNGSRTNHGKSYLRG